MDATALRASTQAATGATAAGTTNGPSSSTATTAGGPVAAPTNPVLLGEKILPAPLGQPQTLHLPDGSMLVPVAMLDAGGNRIPLTGGAGSAPLNYAASATAAAPTATAAATTAPVTGGGSTAPNAGFEPLGILYNDRYFKKFHDASPIDLSNDKAVKDRAIKSTMAYLLEEEPNVDDFGVTNVDVRRVDPARDADLLRVDPRAYYVIDVHGVQGDGVVRSIPSVMNADGAVFTDPPVRRG